MAFKRVFALTVAALAVVPFTAVTANATPSKTSDTCPKGQFHWPAKDCCLPSGGPPKTPSRPQPPSPPSGKSCPVDNHNWYWHEEKSCCVPSTPPPSNSPPPQCKSGHSWQGGLQCCTPSSPGNPGHPGNPPKPSGYPGNGNGNGHGNGYGNGHGNGYGNGHGGYKRSHLSRSAPACPKGLDACPISGLTSGDYECLDTSVELESCGGCASIGQGQDCTAIKGAWNVGCHRGSCKVYTCAAGYLLSHDGTSCIAV